MLHYFGLTSFAILINSLFFRYEMVIADNGAWKQRQYGDKSAVTAIDWALFSCVACSAFIVGFILNSEACVSLRPLFSSSRLDEIADLLLLYPHAPRHLRYTSDLSNPSHRCPFISPPAEFIILDLIIPPSPLQLFVFCSFKDREPSILSQYPRHYVFPSIYLFLALSRSLSSLPSLAVH